MVNDDLEDCYNKILSLISLEKSGQKQNQNFDEIKEKVIELTK